MPINTQEPCFRAFRRLTNQSLTFTAAAGDTVEGRYGNLTLVANGSYVYTPTLTGLEAGNQAIDAFSYEMEDASNVTDTANLTITIDGTSADGEVLASPDTDTVPEDGSTTGDVLANDNGADTVDGFSWGGAGGSLGTPMTIAGVGNFTLWANGSYAFEPAENYTGLVPQVTYTASNTTDGSNATSTSSLTLTITPVNDPPVSTDDSVTTAEDTNITLAVTDFGVFSDVEGDPLTKIQITSLESSGSLEYFNGSAWADVTLNQEVTVGDLANGSLRFVPAADESGSPYTTLQFRVHDGTDYSLSNQTLTVHVTPVNDPPVNTVPGTQTLFDYESLTFSAANGNAISVADVDGNITSVQLTTGAGTLAVSASGSAVVTGTGAAGSPLVISGTQADIAATLAAITYTASSGFVGGDTLRIVTTDGEGLTDADTVPITVNADNRLLAVTGTRVNEASPYLPFQVDGQAGQLVELTLAATGSGAGHAVIGADVSPNLEYYNGSAWVSYSGGTVFIPGSSGNASLLVRVAVFQDTQFEGVESLNLTATNSAGAAAADNGEIVDNGTGDIFLATNPTFTANTSGQPGYPDYLDDDREITINDISVNEDSQYAVFTVTAGDGQVLALSLANGTATVGTDTGSSLDFYNGSGWQPYNGTSVVMNGTTLFVRTSINDDATFEGRETFALTAESLGGGKTSLGVGSIYDDGTGQTYNGSIVGNLPATGSGTDDDRVISIDSLTVNEGSDHAIFTLTGTKGQSVELTLLDDSAGGTIAGKADIDETQVLQFWDGDNWTDYNTSSLPALVDYADSGQVNGTLLVRVDITAEQDAAYEGSETFRLTSAFADAGPNATGTATIVDDGTGTTYNATVTNGTPGTAAGTDDDRPVAVSDVTVAEDAGYAVFNVTGNVGQFVDLATSNGTATAGADFSAALQYSTDNGSSWLNYTAAVAIPAGGDLQVRVPITDDSDVESNETFTLVATNGGGTAANGTGTITDNEIVSNATFEVNDVTVNEGAGTLAFTVTKNGVSSVNSTVDFATTDGTANAGDYTALSGTLDFAPSDTSKTVTVNITNDGVYEGSENFSLVLSNAANATIADNIGIGTILDDGTGNNGSNDDRPAFSIDDVTVNEGAGTLTFTVSKSGNTTLPSTVDFATTVGTANTADYTATNGTLTFAAGDTSKTVTVNITNDGIYEGSENFSLVLSNSANATIADNTGIGTIVDDGSGSGGSNDDRPAFSIDDVTVNEGAGTLTFTVTKSGSTTLPSTVDLATTDGTANAADYTAANGTLTFAAGDASKTVTVAITDDGIYEGSENFSLVLSNAANATIADNTGIGTILDDGTGNNGTNDDRPAFSINDVTVNEGAGTLTFTVSKSGNTTLPSTVDFAAQDGTANAADYTATNGTLTFAAGDTSKTVTVNITNDGIYEGSENFSLVLSNAANATIGDGTGIGTILDDGTGNNGTNDDRPAFSINGVTVNEGAGTLTFTVSKSGNTTLPSTVDFATTDGTATTADYTATNGTLTFLAGETSKSVTVAITNDSVYEGSENFSLVLSNAANATIADNTGIGTILDDGTGSGGTNDDRPAFSINDVTVNEGAGTLTFTVTKSGNTTLPSTVDFAATDGTATTADYTATNGTLTFAAGDTSRTVTVNITNDGIYEGSENFSLVLSNAANATIVDNAGIGTILDDGTGNNGTNDDRPAFSIDDVTVNEGAGTLTFTVTKTGNTTLPSTVDFITQDGTANAADYTATNGTLTFAAGDTSKTVTVAITNDGIYEGSENFSLVLSNAANATIADGKGIGTIVDDGSGSGGSNDDRPAFSIDDVTVNEGAGTLTFTVSKSGNTTLPSTVDFTSADGTANTADYTATNGTLTFAAGDTSKTVTINITNDGIYEGSENFSLVLSNAANATIADNTGIGTILDDGTGSGGTNDDRPAFSIDDVTVNEGAGTLTFTVSKSGNTTLLSTVDFTTQDGTANTADYTATNGTLTFLAGETSKSVTVAITNDSVYEGSENFSLVLSNAANATIADNTGIGTVLDDGTGNNGTNDDRPAFSIDDVAVNEGAGTLTFTVTKSGNTTLPSTVDFATTDGTANAADYTATNGTLTFAAGDTSKTVTVNVSVPAPSFTVTSLMLKAGRSSFVPLFPVPSSRIVPMPVLSAIVAFATFDKTSNKFSEPS